MLQVTDVGLRFGDKELYKEVNLKFTKGNCYGVIGANGAGKSTFLKILSGEIEPNTGVISITEKERMSVLKQDHFKYDQSTVLDTVIMGHERLWTIMKEKDALYMKEDFSDEDGIKAAELEGEFAELDGWDAETNAEKILMGLGIEKDLHYSLMSELTGAEKVMVLLAAALFGSPEILLLDEPTNHLDYASIKWLNEFIIGLDETIVIVVSHDRHFLNTICTHIVDVDFGKIQLYTGNYDFWYESSQLALQLMKDQNKKAEEKIGREQDGNPAQEGNYLSYYFHFLNPSSSDAFILGDFHIDCSVDKGTQNWRGHQIQIAMMNYDKNYGDGIDLTQPLVFGTGSKLTDSEKAYLIFSGDYFGADITNETIARVTMKGEHGAEEKVMFRTEPSFNKHWIILTGVFEASGKNILQMLYLPDMAFETSSASVRSNGGIPTYRLKASYEYVLFSNRLK